MNMDNKKTLVLGASENPSRYSNMAMRKLAAKGYKVVAIGSKKGKVDDIEISIDTIQDEDIETVTLYLNPANQKPYYDYILGLKPKRIVFNPGTENDELERMAVKQGINVLEACTLVMLSTGQY
jgi:predicted CoA-binding protein